MFESDVNELAKLLMGDMAGKWELFLVLLGVPCGVLNAIKQRHPLSPELCLVRGLEHWVLSGSAPTFEKIVRLLRDETPVVNIPLAHRVEEFARDRQGKVLISSMLLCITELFSINRGSCCRCCAFT